MNPIAMTLVCVSCLVVGCGGGSDFVLSTQPDALQTDAGGDGPKSADAATDVDPYSIVPCSSSECDYVAVAPHVVGTHCDPPLSTTPGSPAVCAVTCEVGYAVCDGIIRTGCKIPGQGTCR